MRKGVIATSIGDHRENNFDFLRFLLASVVILTHSFPLRYGPGAPEPIAWLTRGQIDGGSLAVNDFFVISGFLVANSWEHSKSLGDFLRKRALRIYPGFAMALLVCVLVVGPLSGVDCRAYFHNWHTYRFFLPLTIVKWEDSLPGVFSQLPYPRTVDGSLWTLRYEIACYILLAMAGRAGLFRKPTLLAIFFVLAFLPYVGLQVSHIAIPLLHEPERDMIRFVVYFLAGAVLYLFRNKVKYTSLFAGLAFLTLVAADYLGLLQIALPVFGSYVLLFVAFWKSLKLQKFGKLGDFSYGLYIYAWPVQQLLVLYHGKDLNGYTLFLLAFAVTFILAVLSWYLVERPFLGLKYSHTTTELPSAALQPAET